MGRNVITKDDVARVRDELAELGKLRQQLGRIAAAPAPAPAITEDKYKDRLLNYIPADVIAVYLALRGLVAQSGTHAPTATVYWIVFAIVWAITIPWQRKIAKITRWSQVFIGAGAFLVWAISLGQPFVAANLGAWYEPVYGTMLLVLYTFLIPLMEP